MCAKARMGRRFTSFKQLQVKDGEGKDADTRLIPMLREYTVFNVEQCDNLPEGITRGRPMRVRNPDARDALADQFLRSTRADIREGHGEAYYVPSHGLRFHARVRGIQGRDISTALRSMS